jgi:hypothetical protein
MTGLRTEIVACGTTHRIAGGLFDIRRRNRRPGAEAMPAGTCDDLAKLT